MRACASCSARMPWCEQPSTWRVMPDQARLLDQGQVIPLQPVLQGICREAVFLHACLEPVGTSVDAPSECQREVLPHTWHKKGTLAAGKAHLIQAWSSRVRALGRRWGRFSSACRTKSAQAALWRAGNTILLLYMISVAVWTCAAFAGPLMRMQQSSHCLQGKWACGYVSILLHAIGMHLAAYNWQA